MATSATLASTPRFEHVQISTANTARDGTGTITALITGVAAGTLMSRLWVKATGTTTAGMIRFFMSTDGGTTKRLWRELPVAAVTPSATAAAWEGEIDLNNMPLILRDANHQLSVATHNAETFNVYALPHGDLT